MGAEEMLRLMTAMWIPGAGLAVGAVFAGICLDWIREALENRENVSTAGTFHGILPEKNMQQVGRNG